MPTYTTHVPTYPRWWRRWRRRWWGGWQRRWRRRRRRWTSKSPAAPNLRLCGNPLEIFTGDREKADRFLSQLKRYYLANIGVPEFNSWIRRVVIACTYIQGPLVDKWVDRAVDWLAQLDPLIDNIKDVWDQFLDAFAEQFQDSQKGECACTGLENIKMTWPLVDQYIQDFEQLAAKAEYTLGDVPTN